MPATEPIPVRNPIVGSIEMDKHCGVYDSCARRIANLSQNPMIRRHAPMQNARSHCGTLLDARRPGRDIQNGAITPSPVQF
jgi:hypothetical protein